MKSICKTDSNGSKHWYNQNDKHHRIDGPAIEWVDGTKCWYQNDKHHRVDGPAIEWSNGTKSWYLNNNRYTEEEFNQTRQAEFGGVGWLKL